MRSFAYKNENFEKCSYVSELKEGNPCYQASAYDSVMYDETPDGDLIQCDMTQIHLGHISLNQITVWSFIVHD